MRSALNLVPEQLRGLDDASDPDDRKYPCGECGRDQSEPPLALRRSGQSKSPAVGCAVLAPMPTYDLPRGVAFQLWHPDLATGEIIPLPFDNAEILVIPASGQGTWSHRNDQSRSRSPTFDLPLYRGQMSRLVFVPSGSSHESAYES